MESFGLSCLVPFLTGQFLEFCNKILEKIFIVKFAFKFGNHRILVVITAMPVELPDECRENRVRFPVLVNDAFLNDIEENALGLDGACLFHASEEKRTT